MAKTELEEISDQEFEVRTQAGERCVLVSSKVHREGGTGIQTYLFVRDISGLKKKENLSLEILTI